MSKSSKEKHNAALLYFSSSSQQFCFGTSTILIFVRPIFFPRFPYPWQYRRHRGQLFIHGSRAIKKQELSIHDCSFANFMVGEGESFEPILFLWFSFSGLRVEP